MGIEQKDEKTREQIRAEIAGIVRLSSDQTTVATGESVLQPADLYPIPRAIKSETIQSKALIVESGKDTEPSNNGVDRMVDKLRDHYFDIERVREREEIIRAGERFVHHYDEHPISIETNLLGSLLSGVRPSIYEIKGHTLLIKPRDVKENNLLDRLAGGENNFPHHLFRNENYFPHHWRDYSDKNKYQIRGRKTKLAETLEHLAESLGIKTDIKFSQVVICSTKNPRRPEIIIPTNNPEELAKIIQGITRYHSLKLLKDKKTPEATNSSEIPSDKTSKGEEQTDPTEYFDDLFLS